MTITINKSDLVFDIKNKSHLEVASIENIDQRYIAEAASDKEDEITRCIMDAVAKVRYMCGRFLEQDADSTSSESISSSLSSDSSFSFSFTENARRYSNRKQEIASTMHSAIVSMALSKFYISVSQPGLAQSHDVVAANAVALLEKMLCEKLPPVLP